MNKNNIRQVHNIFTRTGFVLNLDQRVQLQTACRSVIRNHSKPDPEKSSCTSLTDLFNTHRQGKKTFRTILTYEKSFYIPHNIKKFSKNIDCTLNLKNSKTLCSLWRNSFMDNEMKTFCFKLHNNTLGYNYTVSKFTRNHNPYRTVLFAPSPGNWKTRGKHLTTFFSLAGTPSRSTKNFSEDL